MTRAEWKETLQRAQVMVKAGHMIDAIRQLRDATNCSVKAAQQAARKLRDATEIK